MTTIRRLGRGGAALWKKLSVEAIERHPDCFVTSADEERSLPLSWFEDRADTRIVLVAGEDAGLAVMTPDGTTGRINSVYVRAEHRGTGVADALLAETAVRAREIGLYTLSLQVFEDNAHAMSLYRRHDFEVAARDPWPERVDYLMTRTL